MSSHREVILDGDIEALIARPTDIECLALNRARRHVDKLLEHAQLDCIGERVVDEHRTRDERERKVAGVDGKSFANLMMQTGLATPELGIIGDVVVNERSGVEVLDGGTGGAGLIVIPANRLAREHANKRTMALARIVRELGKWPVEVAPHVGMRTLSEELGHVAVEARCLFVQKLLEDMIDHVLRIPPLRQEDVLRRNRRLALDVLAIAHEALALRLLDVEAVVLVVVLLFFNTTIELALAVDDDTLNLRISAFFGSGSKDDVDGNPDGTLGGKIAVLVLGDHPFDMAGTVKNKRVVLHMLFEIERCKCRDAVFRQPMSRRRVSKQCHSSPLVVLFPLVKALYIFVRRK